MVVPPDKAMSEMLKAGWVWRTAQHLIKELMSLTSYYNNATIIFSVSVSSKDSLPNK